MIDVMHPGRHVRVKGMCALYIILTRTKINASSFASHQLLIGAVELLCYDKHTYISIHNMMHKMTIVNVILAC